MPLVCAYGRYDLNQKNAKEYGCEDQLEKIGGKIIKALLKDYDMTGDESLWISTRPESGMIIR